MAGDTADTTATARNAPLAAATVETAGKCVLLWPSAAFTAVQGGVQPPSRRSERERERERQTDGALLTPEVCEFRISLWFTVRI